MSRYKPIPVKACKQCSMMFQPPNSVVVFCGRTCWQQYRSVTAAERNKKTCPQCLQQFVRKDGEYCTSRCAALSRAKATRRIDPANYVQIRIDGVWVWEHRYVAAKTLGRDLLLSEEVHHINFVRDDNRPENLEVMDGAEHARLHALLRAAQRSSP